MNDKDFFELVNLIKNESRLTKKKTNNKSTVFVSTKELKRLQKKLLDECTYRQIIYVAKLGLSGLDYTLFDDFFLKLNDPEVSFVYAKYVPECNLEKISKSIFKSKNIKYNYFMTREFDKGVDKNREFCKSLKLNPQKIFQYPDKELSINSKDNLQKHLGIENNLSL